jgi:hypothetical protein
MPATPALQPRQKLLDMISWLQASAGVPYSCSLRAIHAGRAGQQHTMLWPKIHWLTASSQAGKSTVNIIILICADHLLGEDIAAALCGASTMVVLVQDKARAAHRRVSPAHKHSQVTGTHISLQVAYKTHVPGIARRVRALGYSIALHKGLQCMQH